MAEAHELSKQLERAASTIEACSERRALLASHYDADGLSAASILLKALASRGFVVHLLILEQMTPSSLGRLQALASDYPLTLLSDMGSGSVRELSKLKTTVVVLDHHLPQGAGEGVVEVNPHRCGIDGSREVSSSGLAYLLAKELLGEEAVDFAPLAIVGALGDRQDVGERFRLIGVNRMIVREAVEAGLIEERIDLRLFGGPARPIVKALAYTTDPFLPGLTGDEGNAFSFLKSINIEPASGDKHRTLGELTKEERRKLASELVKLMLKYGYTASEAERIYGASYVILGEAPDSPLRDAREYAQLLNASGRIGSYDVAVALCLGARGDLLLKAINVAAQYRSLLSRAFKCVREEKPIREGERLMLVDLRGRSFLNERVSGALASLLLPYVKSGKLLLVALDSPDGIKISARRADGPQVVVGEVLRKAAEKVGGVGGGHERAGGATIPAGKLEDFLAEVERVMSTGA
ncbi:MAG: DHH family phosphoesterase [Thermofilaceae archaeon]